MSISRRQFLEGTALGTLAAGSLAGGEIGKTTLPTRVLGKTGERISILVMGGGSRFLMYKEEEKGLEALNRAFDLGINYMDTAYGYGNGLSEERAGKVLKNRKGIFLATKVNVRPGDGAMRIIEGSLKRLQRDRIDLIHIHALESLDDLAKIEAPDGVLNVLRKLRDQKVIRFMGITCHADPVALKTALERHDFDVTQMALNAGQVSMKSGRGGMVPNEAMKPSFETTALPVAVRKKMGVIAMKIFAQDALGGKATPQKLLYYSLSLPGVTAATVGMPKLEMIEENVRLVKDFKPLPKSEMNKLAGTLSPRYKAALDRHFARHIDA
jgi:predicted aldo/keto reductase-like oxidoreductase